MHRRKLDKIKKALCFHSVSALTTLCVSRPVNESLGTGIIHFIRRKSCVKTSYQESILGQGRPKLTWFSTVHLGFCLWLLKLLFWATGTLKASWCWLVVGVGSLSVLPELPAGTLVIILSFYNEALMWWSLGPTLHLFHFSLPQWKCLVLTSDEKKTRVQEWLNCLHLEEKQRKNR